MNKTKFRSGILAALAVAFALVLSLAIGSLMPARRASASEQYRPTEIFSAGTGGTVEVSEGDAKYVQFKLSSGGKVHFRRDLALKWFESPKENETPDGPAGTFIPTVKRYFSFTVSFPAVNFTKLTFDFESAEENISKESTAKNSLVFLQEEGALYAAVRNASEQDEEEWPTETTVKTLIESAEEYTIAFNENGCDIGEFGVTVNGVSVGKLTNVGGNYMEYLSTAATTPRIPITVTANELSEGSSEQIVVAKSLNGQTFEVTDGMINDNAAPALVLNEEVYAYTLGRKWSLTYEAIDVCDTSVTITRRYAMLGAPDANGKYTRPDCPADADSELSDYKNLTTSTVFVPTSDTGEEEQYVSIFFDLDDGSTLTDSEKLSRRVFLTWYAAENAIASIGEGDDAYDYIRVTRQKYGPSYIGVTADDDSKTNVATGEALAKAEAYQNTVKELTEKVNEKGERELTLSAGDGAYFYLPSLRDLIASDYEDYRNLRFSIFYKSQSLEVGGSASSQTSLRYNALRFEIGEEGKYAFKVLATDVAGNAMQYYVDGKLADVTSANIWDIDEIPEFTFEVTYKGAVIEDPGAQANGYRDSTYNVSSFDVVALSGAEKKYQLFYLDNTKVTDFPSDTDLVENTAKYFDEYEAANYLLEIQKYNDEIDEDDPHWDSTHNRYHWDPDSSSLSFVPQEAGYYFVKLTVTEPRLPSHTAVAYQVIHVQNSRQTPPDELSWLENNVPSVVLFSIAGVLLVVVIVLFVAKPSEKKVEEVDLESLKGGKKNK